jgi:hypothetical protein
VFSEICATLQFSAKSEFSDMVTISYSWLYGLEMQLAFSASGARKLDIHGQKNETELSLHHIQKLTQNGSKTKFIS